MYAAWTMRTVIGHAYCFVTVITLCVCLTFVLRDLREGYRLLFNFFSLTNSRNSQEAFYKQVDTGPDNRCGYSSHTAYTYHNMGDSFQPKSRQASRWEDATFPYTILFLFYFHTTQIPGFASF